MTPPLLAGSGRRPAAPLKANVFDHWAFDEGSSVNRIGVKGAVLAVNGTVGAAAAKVGANAANFDGTNTNFLSAAANSWAAFGDVSWAVGFWFFNNATAGALFAKDNDSSQATREYLLYNTNGLNVGLSVFDAAGSGGVTSADQMAGAGTWNYVAAMRDKAAGRIGVSINAAAYTTASYPATPQTTATALRVGGRVSGSFPVTGRIDELTVWTNYVPTAADLAVIYNGGSGRAYPWGL